MTAKNTDLLDRYLHAVKFWLPQAQQQDIAAELGEDLHSQVEEREAAIGRPLSDEELAAILKQRGAPMRVASGYLPEQRLINPVMLPVYRLVLKIALLWVLAPMFVIVFIGPLFTSAHPEQVLLGFWIEAWRTGFTVVGIVTVVFALFERYHVKFKSLENWDPRKLPRVPSSKESVPRWDLLAGFIFGMFGAIFWVYFLWQRTEFSFPEGIRLVLGPLWKYTYWPVLVLTLTGASADLLAFLYPCWSQTRARVKIGIDVSMIVMAAALLKLDNWGDVVAPTLSAVDLGKVTTAVNAGIEGLLIVIVAANIGDAIQQIRIILRGRKARAELHASFQGPR